MPQYSDLLQTKSLKLSTAHTDAVLELRNRFLPTVICCPIHHWLAVSREVDISRAQSVSDIFSDD